MPLPQCKVVPFRLSLPAGRQNEIIGGNSTTHCGQFFADYGYLKPFDMFDEGKTLQ